MKFFAKVLALASLAIPYSHLCANDVLVRMRAINIMPIESGSPTVVGGQVKINNESVPEIDFTYFITEALAFELILATASHNVRAYGTTLNNLELGDVSILPPVLTAQYHFNFGKLKPYIGTGVNYTFFYGEDPGFAKTIDYKNSFGWATQIGLDYNIRDNIYLNLDLKRIALSTDVVVDTYAHGSVSAKVKIDPVIAGVGVGFRF